MQPQQRMGTAARMKTAMMNDSNFILLPIQPVQNLQIDLLHNMVRLESNQLQLDLVDKYKINLTISIKKIYNEIERFKKSQEEMTKANTLYVQFERRQQINLIIRHEELTKEVRELEGQLADYNLAFDK